MSHHLTDHCGIHTSKLQSAVVPSAKGVQTTRVRDAKRCSATVRGLGAGALSKSTSILAMHVAGPERAGIYIQGWHTTRDTAGLSPICHEATQINATPAARRFIEAQTRCTAG